MSGADSLLYILEKARELQRSVETEERTAQILRDAIQRLRVVADAKDACALELERTTLAAETEANMHALRLAALEAEEGRVGEALSVSQGELRSANVMLRRGAVLEAVAGVFCSVGEGGIKKHFDSVPEKSEVLCLREAVALCDKSSEEDLQGAREVERDVLIENESFKELLESRKATAHRLRMREKALQSEMALEQTSSVKLLREARDARAVVAREHAACSADLQATENQVAYKREAVANLEREKQRLRQQLRNQ